VNEKNGCVGRWGRHLNIVEHFAGGRITWKPALRIPLPLPAPWLAPRA
jgi:hypothetical protein